MKIKLIAVGTRMPAWVTNGVTEYITRMPRDYAVTFIEVPAEKRDKHSHIDSLLEKEAQALFAKCDPAHPIIALDRLGKSISTNELSQTLLKHHDISENLQILIGGPEGIHPDYLKKTNQLWSLSALTLPHPLVRVLIAEQLYRAWSILSNHPYHR